MTHPTAPRLAAVHAGAPGGTDMLLARIATSLIGHGLDVAGVVQTNIARPGRCRCDMELTVLPRGPSVCISQNLGAGARSCQLDPGALEMAVAHVEAALSRGAPDLLMINKFGKQEAGGRGFAPLIGAALAAGVPVLVGINRANRKDFDGFSGGLAEMLPAEDEAVRRWCGRATAARRPDCAA